MQSAKGAWLNRKRLAHEDHEEKTSLVRRHCALDAALLDTIDRLKGSHTIFVIAHRLSTVRRADRIVVLIEGRIVETGNHEELLARGGQYAALHRIQFSPEAKS